MTFIVLLLAILGASADNSSQGSGTTPCRIQHCQASDGSYVLKDTLPATCVGDANATCTQEECCDAADSCQASYCSYGNATFINPPINAFCAGTSCVPERECCMEEVGLAGPIPTVDATEVQISDVSNMQVGDKIILGDGVTTSEHTITEIILTGRRLAEERRLSTSGTVRFTPGVPAATATAMAAAGAGGVVIFSVPSGNIFNGGDPITVYNGHKTKFWIPLGKETLMLATPEISVYATPISGPTDDLQWFGSFSLFTKDGRKIAEVKAKQSMETWHLEQNSKEEEASNFFQHLDITFSDLDMQIEKSSSQAFSMDGDINFGWGKRNLYLLNEELFYIETASIAFAIIARPARNEFPDDEITASKYKHVDLMIQEMNGQHNWEGLFPELWGLKTRSEATIATLTPPSLSDPSIKVCSPKMEATC